MSEIQPQIADKNLRDIHKEALERFRNVAEAEYEQRQHELDALNFKALKQWPDDIASARSGTTDGQGKTVIPSRPMLVIPVLDQPIAQVVNQGRAATLAIHVSPKNNADDEDAQLFEGLVKNIEYESHAQTAYLWAYERAVIAGRGFFRICTDYAQEQDGFDQVVRIERILNQGSVYLDPWAQRADWSDGDWAFVTEDIPVDRYKRLYGNSKLAKMQPNNANDETFIALGDDLKLWMVGPEQLPCYRIAEYWYYKHETSKKTEGAQSRDVTTRTLMCGKLNGVEWLEEPREMDFEDIPIVPVLGNEYNIGGKRMFMGIVQPAMGSCRMINYMASSLAEQAGLATKAPYLAIAGQLQGYEAAWQQANTRNFMALEYNAITKATGGQLLPPPSRDVANPPIDHMTTSIAVFTNFVRSTTGVPDAALGHLNPNDRSGKAIEALKTAAEAGNSNWLDNLARGVQRAGEIVVRVIPKIYDRPGRIVQIIGEDDLQSAQMVNKPFVMQGQIPTPVNGQGMEINGKTHSLPAGTQVKHFDLDKGQYNVVVEVGKSFTTQRAEAQAAMGTFAQAAPHLLPIFADLWVGSMDFPGAKEIASRLAAQNPAAQKGAPQIPPQIQQQMQVQGKLVQELTAQLNQLTQERDAKILENQFKMQQVSADNATKIEIAKIQAAVQFAAVDAKVGAENARTFVEGAEARLGQQLDLLETHLQHAHEHGMQLADQAHERQQQAREHAFTLDEAQQAHDHAMVEGEQANQSAMQQQDNQAANEPADTGSE